MAEALFGQAEGRHVTAEALHREVGAGRDGMSLATVYNTLNVFAEHGLLRAIEGAAGRTVFDTNVTAHHHFMSMGRRR